MVKSFEHPENLICRHRKILGMSAILLPFLEHGTIDWHSLEQHLVRTIEAELIPAVNMDTGFAHLIDQNTRERILELAKAHSKPSWPIPFVAGAFVADRQGDDFDETGYARQLELIEKQGGLPIVFQSHGLVRQGSQERIDRYRKLSKSCNRFLAFELDPVFADFGKVYPLEEFGELLKIKNCIGLKHSSLRRQPEWDRLALRKQNRQDFLVLTGNDLAIDMVKYGSDYLLGLSTFAPDLFAKRDRYWQTGDSRFYELNDQLQYLGQFAFRAPTPAYKHSAAMFLKQRGWIHSDKTHPQSPQRPESDREVLELIGKQMGMEMIPSAGQAR